MPQTRSYHDHHPKITVAYSAANLSRWGFFPVILEYLRGSYNQFGGSRASEQYPQELVGDRLEVVRPLENDDVLFSVRFVDTPGRPEEVPKPRPDPLHGVAVHLSDPVAVIVPREFAPIMVHRRMPSAAAAQRVVPVPVIGVHRRTRLGGGQDRGVDPLGRPAPMSHPEPHPATASADHPGDRRPVGLPGAVALGLVRTPPRRIVGVGVRPPFFPPRFGPSRRLRSGRPAAARGRRPPARGPGHHAAAVTRVGG